MKKPSKQTILTIASVVGVAATTILSVWGGMKTKDILDNKDAKCMTKEEARTKIIFALLPGVAAAVGTSCAVIKCERINAEAIAGLTASVGYLTRKAMIYEQELAERLTPEEMEKIDERLVRTEADYISTTNPKSKKFPAELTGKGELLCLDGQFGKWFRSSKEDVDKGIEEFKLMVEGDDTHERIHACYDDLYELWGTLPTHIGYIFGWPPDEDYRPSEIKFKTTLVHGYQYGDIWIDEDVYIIELEPDSYPVDYWQEI